MLNVSDNHRAHDIPHQQQEANENYNVTQKLHFKITNLRQNKYRLVTVQANNMCYDVYMNTFDYIGKVTVM